MKQTNSIRSLYISLYKFIFVLLAIGGVHTNSYCMIPCANPDTASTGPNFPLLGGALPQGITVTEIFPQCACIGDTFTIIVTIEADDSYDGSAFVIGGFAPNNAGTSAGIMTVPASGVGPNPPNAGIGYNPEAGICTGGGGQGVITVAADSLAIGIPYTFSFDVTALTAGVKTWDVGSNPPACDQLFAISINVTPRAEVPNFTAATGCENNPVTGTLPAPTTGATGPFFYSVGNPTGGTVVLNNPTGAFTFTPNFNFTGVGSFEYNVNPTGPGLPQFCVADPSGIISIPLVQNPIASDTGITGCVVPPLVATGSLVPLVTGGSGGYTFTQVGVASCGSATVTSGGDFTFTGPTGGGTCTFIYQATDTSFPNCTDTGAVTITLTPTPISSGASFTACQNTTLTGTLAPLVTGGSGPLSFAGTGTAPSCGLIFIANDGSFSFIPNFNFTGPCSFAFQATQGGCPATGPNTVTINVLPAPTATSSSTGICAGGTIADDLNNYVISSTGNLTFTGGPGMSGILALDPLGPFTFTPTVSSGPAGFNWRVFSDAVFCPSALQTYNVIVFALPNVVTGQISACSGNAAAGNLQGNVLGGFAPLTFTGPGSVSGGTVVINPNGQFTFTPTPGATGGNFTFGVTDGHGCTGSGTELVIVFPNPIATGGTGLACAGVPSAGSLTGLVTGGTPPYAFGQDGPAVNGMVVVNPNGIYTFTPNVGVTGGSFVFVAADANGCFATAPINITVNPGPSASSGLFTGCEGSTLTGNLGSLVTGPNPPFTFTGLFGQFNGSGTIQANGDFTFTPTVSDGTAGFSFVVSDSGTPSCTSVAPVTIVVEPGPEALSAVFNACQDAVFASGLAPYVSGGMPPFTFMQVPPLPACGVVVVQPNGDFTFTPNLGFSGPCNFFWQVTDDTPCTSNSATATIQVNDSPVASNSGPFASCQNNAFTGNLVDFVTGGIPPYTFVGGNEINGTLNLLVTGPFGFTPTLPGLASFDYSATDTFGCTGNTGTISFLAQESPVLAGPSPLETCHNTPIQSSVLAVGGTPPYNFSIINTVNGSAVIDSVVGGLATFTFTPDPLLEFPMPTVIGSVTIQVIDSNPVTGGCLDTITIDINIHQNPITTETGITACTGAITGSLAPFVTGGVPPYTFAGPLGPLTPLGCGNVLILPNGNFFFVSPPGFAGPCTFEFLVTESSVSTCSSTGAITVNVDIPPVVSDASFCVCADVPVTASLAALTTGGVPPYTFAIIGGICSVVGPQIVSCQVAGGTVLLNTQTGQFTFVPLPGFLGVAQFQFQVTDSLGCVSNIGTVSMVVPCCPAVTSALG